MARPARSSPRESSPSWPEAACDDASAEIARLLALRLRAALGDTSLRAAKARTGVDHTTIAAVLNGTTWADLATIARLELGLNADLWPGRPGAAQS